MVANRIPNERPLVGVTIGAAKAVEAALVHLRPSRNLSAFLGYVKLETFGDAGWHRSKGDTQPGASFTFDLAEASHFLDMPKTTVRRLLDFCVADHVLTWEPDPDIAGQGKLTWVLPPSLWRMTPHTQGKGGIRPGAGRPRKSTTALARTDFDFLAQHPHITPVSQVARTDFDLALSEKSKSVRASNENLGTNNSKTVRASSNNNSKTVRADSVENSKTVRADSAEPLAEGAGAPLRIKTEELEKTEELSEDTTVSSGAAKAVPGGWDQGNQQELSAPPTPTQVAPPVQPSLPTDKETAPTAEFVNTDEQCLLTDAELDEWRQRLEQMEVAVKRMSRGPERDAAQSAHLHEYGEYLTAKRRAHPLPVQVERVSTGQERARCMLAYIQDRNKWPSANGYDSYIAPLEPVDFRDGCLLVRARGRFPADYFNRSLAYKALSLLSGYNVTTIQAIYDAPVRAELDEEEEPAEEETPPIPTYAALTTYATAGEYTNAMMGALIGAWGYEGQTLDETTRSILAKVGAQLRQSRIHPVYVPLFVGWVRRQHRLARPGQMQGLVPDFVKTHKGTSYDNYPPMEQLDWLPQVVKKPGVEKRAKGHKDDHAS